jgi:hypothetical protein
MFNRSMRVAPSPTWLGSWLIATLITGLVPSLPRLWVDAQVRATPAMAAAVASTGPPACTGSRDFIVDHGRVVAPGTQTYDRLCILNGATLLARGDLTLHAGLL